MNIIFYGARQAGVFCLLTLLALRENVVCVIPNDNFVKTIAKKFNLEIFEPNSINDKNSIKYIKNLNPDVLICCHGREILNENILNIPRFGCINLHPCLYKYKGANPIRRLLRDEETRASVGVHYMIKEVDKGETITENFVNIKGCKTEEEVYNKLYLYYSITLIDALKKIKSK